MLAAQLSAFRLRHRGHADLDRGYADLDEAGSISSAPSARLSKTLASAPTAPSAGTSKTRVSSVPSGRRTKKSDGLLEVMAAAHAAAVFVAVS